MATLAQRGSGTPVTNGATWTTVTNAVDGAVGSNPATYAVFTNAVSSGTGYIEIGGYSFTGLPADATLTSITVSVRSLVSNVARWTSLRFQPYDATTAIGTLFTGTLTTTAANDTTTFTPTLAQLKSSTFKIRITLVHAANTQSGTASIDYADVTANYSALLKSGSATTTYTETVAAVGAKPPDPPSGDGNRALESAAARNTEGAVARVLESFVVAAPPNTGTATTTYLAALGAAGQRTPKGANTTTYLEVVAAAGKRAPRGALTTAYVETLAAAGRKAPQGTAIVAHAWTAIAQGGAPAVGVKQGSGLVTYSEALAASAKRASKATATTTYTVTPAAVGKRTPKGAVTTTYVEALTAAGKRIQKGTSTTTYTEAVAGAGKKAPRATVTTAHAWNAIAQGVKPAVGIKQGTGLVAYSETVTAAGKRITKGAASTTALRTTAAAGRKVPKGARVITNTWVVQADGAAPVLLVGYFTVGMQYGDQAVVAWEMDGEGAPV